MKILVADDESEIRKILGILLTGEGHTITEAKNGREAVDALNRDNDIDLVIMDIKMPRLDGISAAREIRGRSSVPILFLTARSLAGDMDSAYAAGGDDYIVKPFSPRELILKVNALARRYNMYSQKAADNPDVISLPGGVYVNPVTREVTKNGSAIDIRDKEMDLLIYLARNRGVPKNASEIYEAVWEEMPLPSSVNTVTVHMLNLRRKLEDSPSSPKLIRTVWGKGYQID